MNTPLHTIDIMSSKIVQEELQMADIVIRLDFEGRAIKFKDFVFVLKLVKRQRRIKLSYCKVN